MMKSILFILIAAFFPILTIAQDVCSDYLPDEGTKMTYVNYDKKGKEQSTTSTEVLSIKTKGDTAYFKVHQIVSTGKEKNDMESDYEFKCADNNFIIDMRSVLNSEMMEAYKDATVTVTSNQMVLPGDMEAGMELDDGHVKMVIFMDPMTTNITMRSFYRKVEAVEEITTPAGTFTAYKIKGYLEGKFAFMRVAFRTIEWYAHDVGIVRSETYDKKDKLIGVSELQKIEN